MAEATAEATRDLAYDPVAATTGLNPEAIGATDSRPAPARRSETISTNPTSALVRDLRAQPARPGMRVMAPSDPEKPEALERARDGIPLDLTTWRELREAAERHGVEAPATVGGG